MEQEYTLKQYCVYVLRKWFVILAAAIIGLGLGVVLALQNKVDYTVEVYENAIDFNYEQYIKYATNGSNLTVWGENSVYSATVTSMVNYAADLKSAVYDEAKDGFNNHKQKKSDLVKEEFFANLNVKKDGYRVIVRFAYRIKDDAAQAEIDRAYATSVVNDYVAIATRQVKEVYGINETSSFADFIKTGDAFVQYDVAELDWVESVNDNSVVVTGAIAAVAGAIVGVIAALAIYLFDKRVKSVKAALPSDKATVLYSGKGDVNEESVIKLAGKIVSDGVKSVLVTTSACENADGFAELLKAKLAKLGVSEVEVEAYENDGKGELTLVCNGHEAVCVLLDQKNTTEKQFVSAVSDVCDGKAKYLGAVVYNTGASYLD